MARIRPVLLVMVSFVALGTPVANACQEPKRPASLSAKAVARFPHIYVVKITKVTLGKRDSWYTPPFRFEGRVVTRLKGTLKKGALLRGATTTEVFRSPCPISLQKNKTYLLFLHGKKRLIVPRFGSRYPSTADPTFKRLVAQIRAHTKK